MPFGHFGPLAIRWYGLAYVAAFFVCAAMLRGMSRRKILAISVESISDLVGWIVTGVIVGGRLGWWLFYHRAGSTPEPWWEPIAIWHGGMSFHGGLIGVAIALMSWSRVKKAPIWNLCDCLALVVPVGLFFGRIANFINAELVGRPTTVPWAMIFPEDRMTKIARHPSQLYEAFLEGPTLLILLWATRKFCFARPGRTSGLFLIAYGLFRFAVEFTREPDAQLGFIAFGWLTMGQLLSAVLVLAGAAVWLWRSRVEPTPIQESKEATTNPAGSSKRVNRRSGRKTL